MVTGAWEAEGLKVGGGFEVPPPAVHAAAPSIRVIPATAVRFLICPTSAPERAPALNCKETFLKAGRAYAHPPREVKRPTGGGRQSRPRPRQAVCEREKRRSRA